MQLNELDKKSLIELKDEIADLEARVKELSAIRVKQDVPLEVLLEQSSYKDVWDETYAETEAQAKDLLESKDKNDEDLEGERLTYSPILESGKTYEQVGEGFIGLFALKIMDGKGLFKFETKWFEQSRTHYTFTAIPEEKYVLFERGLIIPMDARFEVKEIEGHIRYVLAMSTFLNPEIKEVK
jgi:hypothetical protein